MAGKRSERRRQQGEGTVFQRCEPAYGCPPAETIAGEDGKSRRARPKHICRGMWVGQLDLGYVGGKRQRPTVSARTQKAAMQKLRELRERVEQAGGGMPEKGMTVEAWLTYWLDHVVPRKPKTLSYYRNNAKNYLIPALGRKKIAKLRTADVRAMHEYVLSRTKTRIVDGERVQVPLSRTTADHAHNTLVTALNDAKKESPPVVTTNVAELVDPPGRAKSDRQSLTAPHARAVLIATADDRTSSRWMAALLTGARQGECLGLRWAHVDWNRNLIDFAWQLQRIPYVHGCGPETPGSWPCKRKRGGSCPDRRLEVPRDYDHEQLDGGLCLVRPKSSAGTRMVPMVAPLRVAMEHRAKAYKAERGKYKKDHDLVWPRADGRPESDSTDRSAWHAALAAAGVPRADIHAARHTTATLLLEAGVDAKVVQAIVGHSTVAMTRAYQHVDQRLAREGLDKLGKLLELTA